MVDTTLSLDISTLQPQTDNQHTDNISAIFIAVDTTELFFSYLLLIDHVNTIHKT